MSWNLQPDAVKKVLDDMGTAIKDDDNKKLLDVDLKDFSTAITKGGKAAMGRVPAEVESLLKREGSNFTIVGNRFRAAVEGIGIAFAAYQAAQKYMVDDTTRDAKCAEIEQAAIASATSGNFSYFDPYEKKQG